ncbi:MAG: hypothetical protein ROW48_18320 [Bellilinea sp.]|jgi:hypothetical protein
MFPEVDQPLSDDQIKQLRDAQKMLPKLKEQIRRAKLAGLDVSQQELDIADLEGRVQGLLRVYGTAGRSPTA